MVGYDLGGNNNAVNDLNNIPLYNLCDNNLYNSAYADLFDELNISCEYHSENSLSNKFSTLNVNYFSSFALNIQSLPSKYNELINMLSNLSQNNLTFDCICLSETWTLDFSRYLLPNYSIFHAARANSARGGCCIFIKSSIISTQLINNCFFMKIFLNLVRYEFSKTILSVLFYAYIDLIAVPPCPNMSKPYPFLKNLLLFLNT